MASKTTREEKENTQTKYPLVLKVTKQNDGSFKCHVCFNTFKSIQDVTKHAPNCGKDITLKSLDRVNPTGLTNEANIKVSLSCIECSLHFSSRWKLSEHAYTMHKSLGTRTWKSDKAMSCIECHLLCDSKRVLDQHVYKKHESLNPYEMIRDKRWPHNLIERIRCVHCKALFLKSKEHRLWAHVRKEKCEEGE